MGPSIAPQPDESVRLVRQSLSEGMGRFHQIHSEPDLRSIRGSAPYAALIAGAT